MKLIDETYLPISCLVLMSDGEYGTHVYFKHGYRDFEYSFFTDSEELDDIMCDIKNKFEELDSD